MLSEDRIRVINTYSLRKARAKRRNDLIRIAEGSLARAEGFRVR